MAQDLAALVVRLEADASKYLKSLDEATKRLNKFHKDQEDLANKIGERLKEIGTGIAAAFAVEKIAEFTASAIESVAQLEKMSQITGISTENLAGLNLAFAAAGLAGDETGVAMKKLNVSISDAAGNAGGKAGTAFRLMGISVKDANGNIKDAGTVNREVAEAFSKTADGANKVALAVALYGKAGQMMIPTLNQGAKGLEEYQKQAEAWGLTLSRGTTQAAEEFEKKIRTLNAAITGSLSAQLTEKLLPVLGSLLDAFTAGGAAGDTLGKVAEFLVDVFKVLATPVVFLVGEFKSWYEAVSGIVKAYVDLVKLDWSKIGGDLSHGFEESGKTSANTFKAISDMWTAKPIVAKVDVAVKPDAPNLKAGEEQQKAKDALEKFAITMQQQVASFGKGEEALVKYRLQFGDLHKDVEGAGADADKLVAQILKSAHEIQGLKDTKTAGDLVKGLQEQIDKLDQSDVAAFKYKITMNELGETFKRLDAAGAGATQRATALNNILVDDRDAKAVQVLQDEVDKLSGKLGQSAVAAFDLQNKLLIHNLDARDDQAGLAVVAQRRAQVEAEAAYAEQVAKSRDIEKSVSDQEAHINTLRIQGHLTEMEAMKQINSLRSKEIVDLNSIADAEASIASKAGIPALIAQTDQFRQSIEQLKAQTDILEKSVRDNLEQSFANNFADLIMGAKSFRDALKGFLRDIEKMFVDMVAKQYAQQLFGVGGAAGGAPGFLASLASGGGGSGAGGGAGLAGAFAQLFGRGAGAGSVASTGAEAAGVSSSGFDALISSIGTYATGGTIPGGSFGMVGERGAELVYAGSQDLHIQPISSQGKSVHMTNNFNVNAPGGTISRQSQSQTAAEVARTLSVASRRNNG